MPRTACRDAMVHAHAPCGRRRGSGLGPPRPSSLREAARHVQARVMCNRYGYNSPHHRLVELFADVDLPFRWPEASPNLPALEEIRPTDPAPVVQAFEDGVRLDTLRWGFQ